MLLFVYIFLAVLPMTIFGQFEYPWISDGSQIYNLEKMVNQLIDSKIKNLGLVSKEDLYELERKFEAKTEVFRKTAR